VKVREIIRRLGDDGWVLVATRGSHRQYKAPDQAWPCYRCGEAIGRSGAGDARQHPGATLEAVDEEIRAAIRFHIEGLKADGIEIPQPSSIAEYVEA
jgi:hypothetical protein